MRRLTHTRLFAGSLVAVLLPWPDSSWEGSERASLPPLSTKKRLSLYCVHNLHGYSQVCLMPPKPLCIRRIKSGITRMCPCVRPSPERMPLFKFAWPILRTPYSVGNPESCRSSGVIFRQWTRVAIIVIGIPVLTSYACRSCRTW